jgi:hypothetical protein
VSSGAYPWDRHVGSLSVEYRYRNGIAEIIDENHSSFQYYKVVHQNAFLSEFPYNTCNFSRIVNIWLCSAKTAVKKRRYQVVG